MNTRATLVFLFLLFFYFDGLTQYNLTIHTGINVANSIPQNAKQNISIPRLKPFLGFSISRALNEESVVSMGMRYSQNKFDRKLNELDSSSELKQLLTTETQLDYMVVSLDYRRVLKNQLNISIGTYVERAMRIVQSGIRQSSPYGLLKGSDLPEMNKVDYGVSIGLEYQWFERWMLEAQFSQGLKQLYVNPDYYNNAKMRTYSFGIGYTLLKK
jgi:hypothetical protein